MKDTQILISALPMVAFLFGSGEATSETKSDSLGEFVACLSELPNLGTRMGDFRCVSELRSSCDGATDIALAEDCRQSVVQELKGMTDTLLAEIQTLSCEGETLSPPARHLFVSIPQTREWGCEGSYLESWQCTLKVETGNWETARFVRRSGMPLKEEVCS